MTLPPLHRDDDNRHLSDYDCWDDPIVLARLDRAFASWLDRVDEDMMPTVDVEELEPLFQFVNSYHPSFCRWVCQCGETATLIGIPEGTPYCGVCASEIA